MTLSEIWQASGVPKPALLVSDSGVFFLLRDSLNQNLFIGVIYTLSNGFFVRGSEVLMVGDSEWELWT